MKNRENKENRENLLFLLALLTQLILTTKNKASRKSIPPAVYLWIDDLFSINSRSCIKSVEFEFLCCIFE